MINEKTNGRGTGVCKYDIPTSITGYEVDSASTTESFILERLPRIYLPASLLHRECDGGAFYSICSAQPATASRDNGTSQHNEDDDSQICFDDSIVDGRSRILGMCSMKANPQAGSSSQ